MSGHVRRRFRYQKEQNGVEKNEENVTHTEIKTRV